MARAGSSSAIGGQKMKYFVCIDDIERTVEVLAQGDGRYLCRLDDEEGVHVLTAQDAQRLHLITQDANAHPSISLDSKDLSMGGYRRRFRVESQRTRSLREATGASTDEKTDGLVVSPMPGRVVKNLVAEGDTVEAGQGVVVVEAMKMENELKSTSSGTITRLFANSGDLVEAGVPLVEITAFESED